MTVSSERIQHAANLINRSKSVIALTGAGISTASGIPDFRSARDSLWATHNPMQVASLTAFRKDPSLFFGWVRPLLQSIRHAQPNAAHHALAQLAAINKLHAIITQNIDGLHTDAGNKTVFELHGHLRTGTCIHCFKKHDAEPIIQQLLTTGEVPRCDCGNEGVIKPDVILFGEQLPFQQINDAKKSILIADLLIVIGSSLHVAPASDIPRAAYEYGARLIVINNEPTFADRYADVVLQGDVTEILPAIVKHLDEN